MPIYEYECLTCGVVFDKRQSFNDEPKANCPNGHAETRRLLAAPAIVFKGSGFYINDSKSSKNSTNGSSSSKSDKADSSAETKSDNGAEPKSDSKTETKSESSPAKTEA